MFPYSRVNIKVISDLHLEFYELSHINGVVEKVIGNWSEKPDILVLAGDICSVSPLHFPKLLTFFQLLFEMELALEVYWVWGNHEFYGTDYKDIEYYEQIKKTIQDLRQKIRPEMDLFICSHDYLDSKDIFMAPLWYGDRPDVWLLQSNMNDFKQIKNCSPVDFVNQYNLTKQILQSYTEKNVPKFWIFHHLPTFLSITSEYKTDRLNCYYVGDLTQEIINLKPQMVIHGHSHTPQEYWLNRTLIKSNPIGYPK
jgi:predicted MPP superfamily phosphohydrolase